jgi:hypothetical protein
LGVPHRLCTKDETIDTSAEDITVHAYKLRNKIASTVKRRSANCLHRFGTIVVHPSVVLGFDLGGARCDAVLEDPLELVDDISGFGVTYVELNEVNHT